MSWTQATGSCGPTRRATSGKIAGNVPSVTGFPPRPRYPANDKTPFFVLTSPSLGSTVDLHPSTSLLNLGFRNYSFFGPNPSYGIIPRQLSGIPECDLFAQPFRIEREGKEVQPVGAETNSNN